jgi:hypothetical protein
LYTLKSVDFNFSLDDDPTEGWAEDLESADSGFREADMVTKDEDGYAHELGNFVKTQPTLVVSCSLSSRE